MAQWTLGLIFQGQDTRPDVCAGGEVRRQNLRVCGTSAHESGHEALIHLKVDEGRSAIARGTHRSLGVVQDGQIELPAANSVAKCILDDTADIGVPPGATFQFELENAPLKDFSLERRCREGNPLFFGTRRYLAGSGSRRGFGFAGTRGGSGRCGDAVLNRFLRGGRRRTGHRTVLCPKIRQGKARGIAHHVAYKVLGQVGSHSYSTPSVSPAAGLSSHQFMMLPTRTSYSNAAPLRTFIS